jgi:Ca2+-binding RTX toxin-like protein
MALFEYRGQDGRHLVQDSLDLINYAYHGLFEGERARYQKDGYIALSLLETGLGVLAGGDAVERNNAAVADVEAAGWTVLTAEDLGLPSDRTDAFHTYNGRTPQLQNAQADVLAQYDENGNMTQIGFVIRGTSGPLDNVVLDTVGDALDYLEFLTRNPNYTIDAFSDVLEAVRDLAIANGLDASDVLIAGHSLGGGAVTNLAENSDTFLDGFFVDANYIGVATHYVAEDGSSVLDNGAEVLSFDFENDPVGAAIANGLPYLLGNDTNFEFSTDNIVVFNDLYDTAAFAGGGEVINLLTWTAHLDHVYLNAFQQLIQSEFYEEMNRDSLIIVADLSDARRDDTWVEDIDLALANTGHFGDGAYIIGSDFDDRLRGNNDDDAIEGFAGDDWIVGRGGDDRLLGGAGNDRLEGGWGDDRLSDGSGSDVLEGGWGEDVFVFARDGDRDEITDFNEGTDLIDISAWGVQSANELTMRRTGWGEVTITYDDETLVVDSSGLLPWLSLENNDFIFA